jgi:hypothetical protein
VESGAEQEGGVAQFEAAAQERKFVMAVTAARAVRVYEVCSFKRDGTCVMISNNIDVEPSEVDELTVDELSQIAGGTPSIPIPPPKPHVYAIGHIEPRFPKLT